MSLSVCRSSQDMLLLVFACQRARFLTGDRWVNLSAGGKLLLQSGAGFHGTFDATNEGQRLRPVSAPVTLSPHLRLVHSRLGVVRVRVSVLIPVWMKVVLWPMSKQRFCEHTAKKYRIQVFFLLTKVLK